MKIDFQKLIKESGENLSQRQLAKEMADEGLFKNLRSAEMTIQYHIRGMAKSCDYALLKYLCRRFNKKGTEILNWND